MHRWFEHAPNLGPRPLGNSRFIEHAPDLGPRPVGQFRFIRRLAGRGCGPANEAPSAFCCRSRCGDEPRYGLSSKLAFLLRLVEGLEPIGVQTLRTELPVQAFHEGVVGGLARS